MTDCDDDDGHDDCDDDHDHHHHTSAPPGHHEPGRPVDGEAAPVIEAYRAIPTTDSATHPYRRLLDIQGVTVFSTSPDGLYGKRELRLFAESLLRVNSDLLGIPPESGQLVYDDVRFHDRAILVRFKQTTAPPEPERTIPGARVVFVFDPLGHLVRVDNTSRIVFD